MKRHSLGGLFVLSITAFACSGTENSNDTPGGAGGSSQTTTLGLRRKQRDRRNDGNDDAPVFIDPSLSSRYSPDTIQSPLAESVAKQLATIAGNGMRDDHVATRFGDYNCKTFDEFPGHVFLGLSGPDARHSAQLGQPRRS